MEQLLSVGMRPDESSSDEHVILHSSSRSKRSSSGTGMMATRYGGQTKQGRASVMRAFIRTSCTSVVEKDGNETPDKQTAVVDVVK